MIETGLIDTNILVYAFEKPNNVLKKKIAQEMFKECLDGKKSCVISLQNISEFYAVMTSKRERAIDATLVRDICKNLLEIKFLRKLVPSEAVIFKAMELHGLHAIGYWDCLLAATMLANGVTHIHTENEKDFNKFEGIKVMNPFKTSSI